ncbi:tRNA lysidine(34) synthetase TilS [Lawsonia intracellularis]|uniref:tRNA lysidine(34) synthetase TilS n=1 Tax=Lawsonia intracellularis TaxID=29546 RepID=UPI000978002B|nr:tRNA lysidine(34) synthetase TilS [Lawsonia intracellularis]KAA0205329.1 tRNA lysidine(34) synthetase TilS [Lawsonia intracellularis]OMQ04591.1 tRNA lysidine(34) synthetase TilS [Lawsonia intracellularis]RBN33692.1 tRNA lysidine(34) synthetase TilS [Lawsonia intracellularis]RBN34292.1 tRNA lysidine(34) synthetase TilS [Lawsonia intracellularis]UYH53335.1 tRNA lysidine(34) synthetase TilS [Lawsonia intracellularis]
MIHRKLPTSLQDLPSEHARLCLSIKRFLEENLSQNIQGTVIVGCSGGVDSMALALILHCLGIDVVFAHMDHQLRAESKDDANHVKSFAAALDRRCIISRVDISGLAIKYKKGIEETARQERYCFLEQVRKEYGAQWIATGHHLNDLSEDILLRLLRGTGWPGLAGMKAVDKKRYLLRPLLTTRRTLLVSFLSSQNISWVEDNSNKDITFKRNRIRHTILPLFEEENPKFSNVAHMLWSLAKEDEEFWDKMITNVFSKIEGSPEYFWIPRSELITLPKSLRLRVYIEAIRRLNIGQGRASTLFLLDNTLMKGERKKFFQFPGNVLVKLEQDKVIFTATIKNT